jgi:hypothetical protein
MKLRRGRTLVVPKLILVVVCLLVASLGAEAQKAGKVFRVGILGNIPRTDAGGARLWAH